MKKSVIRKGNELIARFMGKQFKDPLNYMYDVSFDWLIPACHKWDTLEGINKDSPLYDQYIALCDKLDTKASLYEIEPLWRTLVECLEWYYSATTQNNL